MKSRRLCASALDDKKGNMKTIRVVAAVILKDGKIFATQRGYGAYKDYWEFPG